MFEFEKMALKKEDLDTQKTIFLVDNFLVSEAITLVYGPPSQGKTWFMLGLTKRLAPKLKKIFYIDFDNPKRQLKERRVDELIEQNPNLKYFSKGGLSIHSGEFLRELDKNAYGENYKECLFIVDSTRDFVDNIHNDTHVKQFMQVQKNIRDAGGTVLLIHHATKNGKVIDGSGEFAKSADNVYGLRQSARVNSELHYALNVENDRDAIYDCGFSIDTETLILKELDVDIANMNMHEKDFVDKVIAILDKNSDGVKQGEILEEIFGNKRDKKGTALLKQYENIFYKKEENGNSYLYFKI